MECRTVSVTSRSTRRLLVFGTGNRKKAAELADLLGPPGLRAQDAGRFPQAIRGRRIGPVVRRERRAQGHRSKRTICKPGCWPTTADWWSTRSTAAPGIYSARYAGPGATDADNRRKLLAELTERRPAAAHRALRLPPGPGRSDRHRAGPRPSGTCHGRISRDEAGSGGFGYDPLFEVIEYHRTFGELSAAVKAVLSHRARAMYALRAGARALAAGRRVGARVADTFESIAKTFFGLEEVLAGELAAAGRRATSPSAGGWCAFRGDQQLLYRANIALSHGDARARSRSPRFRPTTTRALYRRHRPDRLAQAPGRPSGRWPSIRSSTAACSPIRCMRRKWPRTRSSTRFAASQRPAGPRSTWPIPTCASTCTSTSKRVTVYLDASGDSLHKRGYRTGRRRGADQRSAGRRHPAAHRVGSPSRAGRFHVRLGHVPDRSGARWRGALRRDSCGSTSATCGGKTLIGTARRGAGRGAPEVLESLPFRMPAPITIRT